MGIDVINKLKLKDSRLGYVKVNDGSVVILRVAIVDARIREEASPFGVDFDVDATVGMSVYPSDVALSEVKDKPVLEPGKSIGEGWMRVEITEKLPAYEEAIYEDDKNGRYLIRAEIEPLMVSKNTQFKSFQGLPLYAVRWVPKVSWREFREVSLGE